MATPTRRPPSRPIPKPPVQAPVAHVPAPEPVAPVVDELGLGVQGDSETDLQESWPDIAMPGAEQASEQDGEQEPAQAFTQENIDAAFAEAPEQQEGEQESEQIAVPDPAPFPPGYTPRTMEEQTRLEQWCGRQHHRQHLARRAAEMAPPNNE